MTAKLLTPRQESWLRIKADPERYAKVIAQLRQAKKSPHRQAKIRAWRKRYAKTPAGRRQAALHQRRVRLKRLGLTVDDYDRMFAEQSGRCAICGTDQPARGTLKSSFPVDHCHKTGRVRGLLCHHCNVTLGRFFDSADDIEHWAKSAAAYLRLHAIP